MRKKTSRPSIDSQRTPRTKEITNTFIGKHGRILLRCKNNENSIKHKTSKQEESDLSYCDCTGSRSRVGFTLVVIAYLQGAW